MQPPPSLIAFGSSAALAAKKGVIAQQLHAGTPMSLPLEDFVLKTAGF